MDGFDDARRVTTAEAVRRVPGSAAKRYEVVFEHGTLQVGIYAPVGVAHGFEQFSNDLAMWVLFYGPEGGERGERS